jgi:hypothetical protein
MMKPINNRQCRELYQQQSRARGYVGRVVPPELAQNETHCAVLEKQHADHEAFLESWEQRLQNYHAQLDRHEQELNERSSRLPS